ncbi:FUSC family protein [Nocardioides bruguierae]|uniref:FUSC family protein n=1 Tax=Nocardioides bruguierae TaxID=2945102 RepID=UPI002020E425|nr:FUSC family protein [Nocardioides bruguierae]MCL8025058.1 FUSC family protein [Nocardioides bruguierae]
MPTLSRRLAEALPDAVRRFLLEARDRARVSDPGAGRLRQGLSAAVCVGGSIPLQMGVSGLLGHDAATGLATVMLGAITAMLGSNALFGSSRGYAWRTAAWFPVAAGLGVGLASVLGDRLTQGLGFAVVLFLAVWVRRFGGPWFFYGFLGWMGFFAGTFLQVSPPQLPALLLAAVVSAAWVATVTSTLLHADPRRVLHATLGAFFAGGRAVAREAADLLEVPPDSPGRATRAERALGARVAALGESALLVEAWSQEPRAVPEGWSAAALRRRTLEAQQAAERCASAAEELARLRAEGVRGQERLRVDVALVDEARRALDHLAARRDRAAEVAADRLVRRAAEIDGSPGLTGGWQARHLAHGLRELLRFDHAADEPPEVDPGEVEFEAATSLVFGGLPGSPAVARDVQVRGSRLNPLTRVSMTTRQAVQMVLAGVLALLLGSLLSPTRYYWAVVATFITVTGTGSRTETFVKGLGRVVGTLLGIAVAIVLAHATAGSTPLVLTVILVSIFLAMYFVKVSQAATAFFITLVLGELYTVLGSFSDDLLALRLGETLVGALTGAVVALVIAPLSTRDTVRAARDELYEAMATLLDGVATYTRALEPERPRRRERPSSGTSTGAGGGSGADGGGRVDLDALARAVDDKARRVALVARPLVRTLPIGASSRGTRRRLGLYAAATSQCRALALSLQARPPAHPSATAAAAEAIAQGLRALTAAGVGQRAPQAEEPLSRGGLVLFAGPHADRDDDPVVRHLHHLTATLGELAGVGRTSGWRRSWN